MNMLFALLVLASGQTLPDENMNLALELQGMMTQEYERLEKEMKMTAGPALATHYHGVFKAWSFNRYRGHFFTLRSLLEWSHLFQSNRGYCIYSSLTYRRRGETVHRSDRSFEYGEYTTCYVQVLVLNEQGSRQLQCRTYCFIPFVLFDLSGRAVRLSGPCGRLGVTWRPSRRSWRRRTRI